MTPRIPPIPFKDWPVELTAGIPAIEALTPSKDSPRKEIAQKGRNALGTLAHHPALAKAWLQFMAQVQRNTTLACCAGSLARTWRESARRTYGHVRAGTDPLNLLLRDRRSLRPLVPRRQ